MKVTRFFCLMTLAVFMAACGLDVPEEVQTSYQTLTISKSDITIPLKYSATLKGTSDVTIKPQITALCTTE